MAFIYQIRNLANNKIYIGSTQKHNLRRKGEHFCQLKGNYHYNNHLQKAFNKYGEENFVFEVLEEIKFGEEDNDSKYLIVTTKEIEYINKLNPAYNICKETKGGKLGRIPTQEEREKSRQNQLGRKHTPETVLKIKLARSKQVITEDHKNNISKSLKGNSRNKGHKQSVEQRLKMSQKMKDLISKVIGFHSIDSEKKRNKTLKLLFNTPEMKLLLKTTARNRNIKPFIGYINNDIIGEFTNQTEAGEILNLKPSEIGAVLRKEQKTTRGYIFEYKEI